MEDNKETQKELTKKKKAPVKQILAVVVLIIVVIGCGTGYYYFSLKSNYFSTDNAKVTAKMYNITAPTSGKLLQWDVDTGDLVSQDQILGRQQTLPYITSPIKGTVVKNDAALNQTVSPNNVLAVVADTDHMYIGVNIEETDINKIKLGQNVDVKIDAYGNRVFHGTVTEIDPATQTFFSGASSFSTSGTYTKVTQLIPIKVVLTDSQDVPMALGMNATVSIHLK